MARGQRRLTSCRSRQLQHWYVLHWWVRATAWLASGAPILVVEPLAAPLGPLAFEVLVYLAGIRARRRWWHPKGPRPGPPGPPDGYDREPRRPAPMAGAGSAAVPEPSS